jgi:hypothetical protein
MCERGTCVRNSSIPGLAGTEVNMTPNKASAFEITDASSHKVSIVTVSTHQISVIVDRSRKTIRGIVGECFLPGT